MNDSQPAASYPGFQISAEGLKQVHQALGMYVHQSLELSAALKAQGDLIATMNEQIGRLTASPSDAEPTPIQPTPMQAEISRRRTGG